MWQRPHDHYLGLDPSARSAVAPLLTALPGAEAALSSPVPRRVVRRANKLLLA
jgi:hypothetical protein